MTAPDQSRDFTKAALAYYGHCFPALAFWTLTLAAPSWLSIDALTPITSPLALVSVFVMFLSLLHTYVPDSDCQRCDRARGHDPRSLANRQVWMLWFDHKMNVSPGRTWALLIVGVLATNVAVYVTGVTLLYIPFDVTFTIMCWSAWRHFLLSPWCVYCRDDDGWDDDEHERIPDPVPVGQGTRQS